MRTYTELQVTTNFSFLRGASHPEELIHQAKALGYEAIAVTDRNSVAGIVRAHQAAKETGVKLIVGCRLELLADLTAPDSPFFSLLVYPTDLTSYGRLCTLLTVGKFRSPKGECYLTVADVLEYHEGLLAIAVIQHPTNAAVCAALDMLRAQFGDRLSLTISMTYDNNNQLRSDAICSLSAALHIPLVVTNDVQYHTPERKILQDVLTCIRLGKTLATVGFDLLPNAERYLKPEREMIRLFRNHRAALNRSVAIAKQAGSFSLDQVKYEYPHEICPPGKSPISYLTELTWDGAALHYPQGIPEKVRTLIEHELKLIDELNYAKYFLTVYDIISCARRNNILFQGRGAAANSAVCYVLGITAVDPDKIALLFERFVSRERNEPPDIDIDFEHERREEIIQYIYEKYGRKRAALVAEVITYRARSAVRDVGKAFGLSLDCIETLSKSLDWTNRSSVSKRTLRSAGLSLEHEAIRLTVELSRAIIGFPRHLSQHVGGFVITEGLLSEIVPIENATMAHRSVIEWDKDDVETMGMLKIDILGLGMLTCIRKAFELVNTTETEKLPDKMLKLHTIPSEDEQVYEMICRADTVGVFQIESRAQMSMLPRLKPVCFYDLVIEVAIVRPGPIQGGMVHPFLRRRNGEEVVSYPNEQIRNILQSTLGVPIFQEQVMQLAVVAAGFTPGEADNLRRAMSAWKRNGDLITAFGEKIISGMLGNGYSREFAEACLNQIKGFGEYGFPQSHAASFALLVYVSAWLKCHYPATFAAALLNSQPMGFYAPAQIIRDLKEHHIPVLPIDVNFSRWDATLANGKQVLRLGLRLVKGLQQSEAEKIVLAVKRRGSFTSLSQLWRESGVRIYTLLRLARADAFSSFGLSRQQALWEIKRFRDEPLPLFDRYELVSENLELPPLDSEENVIRDYQTTGLSLKAHPISFLRKQLAANGAITAADLRDPNRFPKGTRVSLCGLVLVRQRPSTSKGVVFMTIEDETGVANLIIRPQIYERYRETVRNSVSVFVSGQVERQGEVIHLLVSEFRTSTPLVDEGIFQSRDFH